MSNGWILKHQPRAKTRVPPVPEAQGQHRLLGLYMLAAASLFMHEIAWARVATLLLGSTTYAFSLLLAVIVAGLALGGLLATRFVATAETAKTTLAAAQGLVAIAGLGAAARRSDRAVR